MSTSTSLLEIHLRLMSMLPVRTHHCTLPAERRQGVQFGDLPQKLIEEFKELRRRGCTAIEVRKILHIGARTYKRLKQATEK